MIVPMKKVAVIVQSKDADSAVKTLGSLGVLHVEHQKAPKGRSIFAIRDDIALAENASDILKKPEFQGKPAPRNEETLRDWKTTAKRVIDLSKRLDQLEQYSRSLANQINEWKSWGNFDPETIKALRDKNIYVKLYRVPAREIKNFPSSAIVKRLKTIGGIANCVVISKEELKAPFKELSPPKISPEAMRARLAEDGRAIGSIKNTIKEHARYAESFKKTEESLEKELKSEEALKGMGQSGDIMYLTGYIPHDAAKLLSETARREKWGISVKDPSEEDMVPTLIRNPRWISLISPIFKIIEIIPGYRELDISLWFLVFFSIFFGMLIGDAGYGAVYFLLTLLGQMKWGRKMSDKSVFILFYILSSCAIVWGVLTGTFFGQEWLGQSVKPLLVSLRNHKNVQSVCFFLGAFHLSIAHLWRAARKLPSPAGLADIGWVLVLWGAFFLAKMLILGEAFPGYGKWFFVAGITFVIFFTKPRKNVLKGIGAGFGNLLLNIVNSFTDLVSYIRLFAVGLATVAVADSFNNMAMGIGYNSILTGLLTSLILLTGHTLNIVLGPMSILVHGVRLNVLEFCNHLDLKWSGFLYKPLKGEK